MSLSTKNLAIIGAGAWGSALAIALSVNFDKVFLLCADESQVAELGSKHPALGDDYSANIVLTSDYNYLNQTTNILIATPSYAFNEVLTKLKPYINTHKIAWATKGFFGNQLLHQSFLQFFPNLSPCLISGPSFAKEVANFQPTALVVASPDNELANHWSGLIKTANLRPYISDDIIGCEVGGAVKNIIAIAAGISSGLGFGTNAMSALITRGLAEMSRFGIAIGAKQSTFMGLTGLGDLTLTCLDDKSRNRSFGKELSQGANKNLALQKVGATVEGLNALPVVLMLAKKQQIKMPICASVDLIINHNAEIKQVVSDLMDRKNGYE